MQTSNGNGTATVTCSTDGGTPASYSCKIGVGEAFNCELFSLSSSSVFMSYTPAGTPPILIDLRLLGPGNSTITISAEFGETSSTFVLPFLGIV